MQYADAGLILKRAREPDALYFAGCESGRLFQNRLDIVLTCCIHAESLLDLLVILSPSLIIFLRTESYDRSIDETEK